MPLSTPSIKIHNATSAFDEAEIEGSLPARFEKMVVRHGARLAVKSAREQLTYRELNARANGVAAAISQKSSAVGKPIALLFEPGANEIAAILGVLQSGHFYVPLDPSYPPVHTARILEDAEPILLLTDSRHEETARQLADSRQCVLNVNALGEIAAHRPAIAQNAVEQNADALAYMIYTSGSSGEPKGVMQTHRNVLFDIRRQSLDLQTTVNDRYGLLFSSSSSASICHIFGALLNGAAVLPFDVRARGLARLARWMAAEEITILDINVAMFRQWCAILESDSQAHSASDFFLKLRLLAPGSEPVYKSDAELYRRHFPATCVMQNALGTTETRTTSQYFLNHQTRVEETIVPVGSAVVGKEILLLNENRLPVAYGDIGEITIRSRYLSPGYWNRMEQTEAVFLPDPQDSEQRIYLTGDLGRYNDDGQLVHLGRKDFQVKIFGNRVEIAEVEMAISTLTGLSVAVAAFADENGNQQLAAYIAVGRRSSLSIRELRDQLSEQLPIYAVPTRFEFLDALPLTLNGKLDRRALRAPEPVRAVSGEKFVKPCGRFETTIARLFEEVLDVESVGATDDFFALGGHSLLAIQLTSRIEEELEQVLSLSAVVEAPTVRELSFFCQEETVLRHKTLVQIQKGQGNNSRPPLFCVPGRGGSALEFHRFVSYLGSDQTVYGFDSLGLDGCKRPHKTIEDMSEHYLAEIKNVQPNQPYLLCGFSMGGLVAFEIARRLRSAGDEVALLGLFDTDCRRDKKNFTLRSWRSRIALRSRFKTRCRQLQYYWHLNRGQVAPSHVINANLDRVHALAASRYVPGQYSGVITYFRAKERTGRLAQSALDGDWNNMTGAQVETHDIPGNHFLIREPHVGELARQMRYCIEKAFAEAR